MSPPGVYEAKLEALYASTDTNALTQAVYVDIKDISTARRSLDWLRDKLIASGGSSYLSYMYSASLWRASKSTLNPAEKKEFMDSAAVQLLLARLLIRSEGFQCADKGAPGARLALVNSQLAEVEQYLNTLPQAERARLQQLVFNIDTKSFRSRQNDVWLCRGGPEYWAQYLEKHPELGNKDLSSLAGTTMVVPLDPQIMPGFVPFEQWKEKRRAVLDKAFDEAQLPRPNDYFDSATRLK